MFFFIYLFITITAAYMCIERLILNRHKNKDPDHSNDYNTTISKNAWRIFKYLQFACFVIYILACIWLGISTILQTSFT